MTGTQAQKDSKLVFWIRCFHCGVEQTVIGPSSHPTFERPGWMVDHRELYRPGGHHYCEKHARQAWEAWCEDPAGCDECLGGRPFYLDAPAAWDRDEVVDHLREGGYVCHNGIPFIDVEAISVEFYPDLARNFEVRL